MLSSEISKLMKVTFIGSPAVGKTTMLRLFSKNLIDKFYFPTHGFDLKTIKLDDYNVRVWDFGGQHSYFNTKRIFIKKKGQIIYIYLSNM